MKKGHWFAVHTSLYSCTSSFRSSSSSFSLVRRFFCSFSLVQASLSMSISSFVISSPWKNNTVSINTLSWEHTHFNKSTTVLGNLWIRGGRDILVRVRCKLFSKYTTHLMWKYIQNGCKLHIYSASVIFPNKITNMIYSKVLSLFDDSRYSWFNYI